MSIKKAKKVKKTFSHKNGQIHVFKDVNLSVKPGDLVRFLEKNIDKSNNILAGKINNLIDMTSDQWAQYVKEAELYIIYTSYEVINSLIFTTTPFAGAVVNVSVFPFAVYAVLFALA